VKSHEENHTQFLVAFGVLTGTLSGVSATPRKIVTHDDYWKCENVNYENYKIYYKYKLTYIETTGEVRLYKIAADVSYRTGQE